MSSDQRGTRRRSARLAFEDEQPEPAGKRTKTDANGTSGKGTSRANGATTQPKRTRAAYDEEDDGFQFTRGRTTKSRAAPAHRPEPIAEEPNSKPAGVPSAKRKKTPVAAADLQPAPRKEPARRSSRLSGETLQTVPPRADPDLDRQTKRPKQILSKQPISKVPQTFLDANDERVEFVGANEPALKVAKKRSPTKIALPSTDTPMNKRNKEMRKEGATSNRRSSSGLRGRRASALMESGQSSVPHEQVPTDDYYKHIDMDLIEPKRMAQLLTWCASKALLEKPSGAAKDHNAIMAARQIQKELLDDFASKPAMSNWFSRPDDSPSTSLVRKPNPRNVENAARLKDLEAEIDRLEEQERAWKSLTQASTSLPEPPTRERQKASANVPDNINPNVLDDPVQSSILASLTGVPVDLPPELAPVSFAPDSTPTDVSARLTTLSQSLEPTIDVFADGVHKLSQYRQTAERAAEKILNGTAERLEKREQDVKEKVGTSNIGTDDVLRALGGMLNRR
ncbi:hypothetical protein EJ05DRAFT_495528 [Pseudovirgaria hyperparasitica]|uniref:Uncharacterized protein n=1 Tax=Pseudovirgaria hyperparasitica TaxID=470096 RepID=A0A6A6WKH2_9PEZI|nr:uncharacterized protein EJ05DRAFT_495528 [Pseudovirgaria hyperparasitica]KAF2762656.1 hypothetical protein EJ05DRAFT_495528 [Pseudovirgaria hyperparasitica]